MVIQTFVALGSLSAEMAIGSYVFTTPFGSYQILQLFSFDTVVWNASMFIEVLALTSLAFVMFKFEDFFIILSFYDKAC